MLEEYGRDVERSCTMRVSQWRRRAALVASIAMALTFGSLATASAETAPAQTHTLFAARHDVPVGVVSIANECPAYVSSRLYLDVETTGGWMLTSVDVAYGADVTDIPATNSGNPKIGRLPVRIDVDPDPVDIDRDRRRLAPGQQLAVAVHANVVR
ncbi:MAG: hypothetical protein R2749_14185 [Acidimicrobiales bacterium]